MQKLSLVILLLLYTAIAVAHSSFAPLTTGPDELAHYEYINFIANYGRLPLDNKEREMAGYKSDQPPLYHLLAAIPASLVDTAAPPFLKRVGDHPRRQLIERTRHFWGIYNTEDELWPYKAEILRWHVGRWVAVFFGMVTVATTFFITRELFTKLSFNEPGLSALGAAAIVAFIPRFVLTGSMLNYETTQAFLTALFLWVLLRISNKAKNDFPSVFYLIMLGLFTGLAITTKLSAVILPLELLAVLWLIGRYNGWGWIKWLKAVSITVAAASTVVGLWIGFILYQFNTIARDGWWVGILRPLIAADASDATTNRLLSLLTNEQAGSTAAIKNLDSGTPWEWLAVFFRTFWVVGIEGRQPLGLFGLLVALALCLIAAYGLLSVWRKTARFSYSRLILSVLLLNLAMPFILPLLRYAATFSLADTAQGRHVLFMAAPAFAILIVWGISGFGGHKFISLLPALFLLMWSGVQLWHMSWAYNPLLPVRSLPEAVTQADYPVELAVNEYMSLSGYSTNINDKNRMLRLDLFWLSTAISPVDYLTEVTLVSAKPGFQSQWLGYPAGGRYPTRAWDVGDIVRDTVWLPIDGLQKGNYQLKLNLIDANSMHSPPESIAAPLAVIPVELPSSPPASALKIWRNGQTTQDGQSFNYRETIFVTLDNTHEQNTVQIISPSGTVFNPVRDMGGAVIFIVGADWSSGEYRLLTADGKQFLFKTVDRWQRQFTQPPISRLVKANFANHIELLGYDLANNRAEPGGSIPLTIYWRGLDWMGEDYTIFAKLLSSNQTAYGGRDRFPREGYSTLYWSPGEIINDPFGVPVEADAPDGIYYISVGLYKQVGQQAVSLPRVENGQAIDSTSIDIGPIKIGQTPPGFTVDNISPQTPLNIPFGDSPNITLLGYELKPELESGQISLTLYWRSEARLSVDYTTFVHLRNAAGETVAQKDQPPLNGAYPTSLWDTGEIIADKISLPLPAGEYKIIIGMYDFQTGRRLPVPNSNNNEVELNGVKIP